MAANLDILIRAQNQASGALRAVKSDLSALDRVAGTAGRGMSGLQNVVGVGLLGAATAAGAGLVALGAGMGAATVDGFRINTSLENVRAQLVAFTKDGAKADQMLADIRTEAAKTPFAFEELASATASLLPASIQSGVALEDLIQQAEILAASNPAQGLEGAAFSLREALSGDFVSIIDRFNLPRTRLNQLKEEGVPAMEAISIAMSEMGLDASLVAGMALTMTGRWSTFKDTMDTLKATLAQPLFDLVKTGLSDLQPLLDANMPKLQEIATTIGEKMAGAVEALATRGLPRLIGAFDQVRAGAGAMSAGFSRIVGAVQSALGPVWSAVAGFVSWKDVLIALGLVAASVIIPALAGIVAAALPVIAVGAALVAGVAVLRNAWEGNWGGIRDITANVIGVVGGWIDNLRGWLAEKIPGWVESARGAFDTLLGWVEAARGGDFAPLLTGLGSAFNSALSGISTAIQSFAWADWIDGALNWATYVGTLAWDTFVSALSWGADYITSLDWGSYITALTDWGTYIGALAWSSFIKVLSWTSDIVGSVNWGSFIDKLTDWSTAVGTVAWSSFISLLTWGADVIGAVDWATFIDKLTDWGLYVGKLAWDGFVTVLSWLDWIYRLEWSAFIKVLTWGANIIKSVDWSAFIANLSAWSDYVSELTWSTFVSALTWGTDYVSTLNWSDFVTSISDWGTWIASLDWTKIITTTIDWATWIPAMVWNNFVKLLDWATIVAAFAWTEYISKLTWADVMAYFDGWGDAVGSVDWSERIAAFTDWASYIAEFAWSSFVDKLDWPLIAQFDWASWIASFRWPTLPSFSWSSWIASFNWPTLPTVNWSSFIPSFSWPSIPSFPGWGAIFGGGKGGDSDGASAAGTPFWRGGRTLVGERGPELVTLPRGSRIHNAEDTARMGGSTVNVTVNASVADGMDAEALAYRIASIIQRRQRAGAYA